MSHLWLHDEVGWAVLPLEGDDLDLGRLPVPDGRSRSAKRNEAVLVHVEGDREVDGAGGWAWGLLADPHAGVWLNGVPLLWGAHALQHQDEIRVAGRAPAYFSTERLARVEPMRDMGRTIYCPRCSLEVTAEDPAVCCPACGIWHHSSEKYPCWGYGPACSLCPQSTDLHTGFRWTPAAL